MIRPHFEARVEQICLHKNQLIEIDEFELLIKYSRPYFGKVVSGTEVKIESSTPKRIQNIRIAPIWATEEKYQ